MRGAFVTIRLQKQSRYLNLGNVFLAVVVKQRFGIDRPVSGLPGAGGGRCEV